MLPVTAEVAVAGAFESSPKFPTVELEVGSSYVKARNGLLLRRGCQGKERRGRYLRSGVNRSTLPVELELAERAYELAEKLLDFADIAGKCTLRGVRWQSLRNRFVQVSHPLRPGMKGTPIGVW